MRECLCANRCVRPGTPGIAFLGAGGVIMSKSLGEGEQLILDTNSLVAWTNTSEVSVKVNSCCNCCCSGEGLFDTVVTGPGKAWIQTMGLGKFKNALADYRIQQLQAQGFTHSYRSGAPATHEAMDR